MYPIWEGLFVHSAMYVAIIATFHVLASHLTVAGAWFNLYIERRAVRENRPELYEYLKRSALGLMVFSYVFGAMSGVGIWQSTTAANPRGISTLIHNFVFYWGSEWYMFLIDVIGIIAYYYTIGRVSKETHLRLAWILALGGSGTLSLIVGILSFKLTPGAWLENGLSLAGFYNPTFWPQWLMRFAFMFVITGGWSLIIATGIPRGYFEREKIIRYAGGSGLIGLVIGVCLWLFWYEPTLPIHARTVMVSPAVVPLTYPVIITGIVAAALGLGLSLLAPQLQRRWIALILMALIQAAIFGAERVREVIRKPDIISGYMSSNQLLFNDLPARGIASEEANLKRDGMMGNLPFMPSPGRLSTNTKIANPQLEIGRTLVTQQCSACHNVSLQTEIRVVNRRFVLRSLADLLVARQRTTAAEIDVYIKAIQGFPYMHEMVGTDAERAAMAIYLEHFITQTYDNQATTISQR